MGTALSYQNIWTAINFSLDCVRNNPKTEWRKKTEEIMFFQLNTILSFHCNFSSVIVSLFAFLSAHICRLLCMFVWWHFFSCSSLEKNFFSSPFVGTGTYQFWLNRSRENMIRTLFFCSLPLLFPSKLRFFSSASCLHTFPIRFSPLQSTDWGCFHIIFLCRRGRKTLLVWITFSCNHWNEAKRHSRKKN